MFMDLRPLEKFSSVLLTVTMVMMSLGMPAFVLLGAAFAMRESLALTGGLCCVAATMPVIGVLGQLLMRWSRRGSAHKYLQAVAGELGVEAEVTGGTLLLPMLSPRLECILEGRTVSVTLRRTAGVLSAPWPGGSGLRPWTQTLQVSGSIPAKVGFAHEKSNTFGASLLGVSEPQKEDGVLVFAGKHPDVATHPDVLAAARAIEIPAMSMVVAGPAGLSQTLLMRSKESSELSERLPCLARLMAALEAASASSTGASPPLV